MDKKNIGVIFGSRSCEHDISIISAVQFMGAIDKAKYNPVPIYIAYSGQWYTGEALSNIATYQHFDESRAGITPVSLDLATRGELVAYEAAKGLFASGIKRQVIARIDCVCIIMHGMNGEDGTLQGLFEIADLPYTSTGVAGSAVGMDKIMMKQFFRGANLPVLDNVWFTASEYERDIPAAHEKIEKTLGFPVFVKPANLGSSIGVSKASNSDELKEAMAVAFSFDRRVLVEKGLNAPMEINCSVLGYDDVCEASVLEMPNTGGEVLDFMAKYLREKGQSEGMASLARIVPAPIEDALRDQIQAMSKDIFRMLDCKGVVRIDYMKEIESDQFFITEINTIPGSLAFYLWEHDGIAFTDLADKMIEYAFRAFEDKHNHNYSYKTDVINAMSTGGAKSGTKGKLSGGKVG